ncbi:MAG TPA: hypothetical protein VMX75_12525, partial [Spirochaetia bacterium]|nr:hypothetical protein [Spirochaetia bacterium]
MPAVAPSGCRWSFIALLGWLFFLASLIPSAAQRVYWDEPKILEAGNINFVQADSGGGLTAVAWQEFEGEKSYVSLRVSRDLVNWSSNRRFAGPFQREEKETPLFTLALDEEGRIYLALVPAENQITLMLSEDEGKTFMSGRLVSSPTILAPKLFIREGKRGLYLFTIRSTIDSITIHYAELNLTDFRQERTETKLRPFVQEASLTPSFLPYYASFRGVEYVAYQYQPGRAERYQIYLKISDRNGSFDINQAPIPLTARGEVREGVEQAYTQFDNQRPFLKTLPDRVAVTWERSFRNGPYQLYYLELDETGRSYESRTTAMEELRVTESRYNCRSPKVFMYKQKVYLIWFDNRRGENQIVMALKDGQLWRELDLTRSVNGDSIYPWPILTGDYLNLFWQNHIGSVTRLISLEPDQRVSPPRLIARNFVSGRAVKSDTAVIGWTVTKDFSGIAGFSYLWDRNPKSSVEKRLMLDTETTSTLQKATGDGAWYFHLTAMDNAGNWSSPVTLEFIRDTERPAPASLTNVAVDSSGFLASNNPEFHWAPPEGEEISGYTYVLKQLSGNVNASLPEAPTATAYPSGVLTQQEKKSYYNIDNGLWVFGVATIDLAGNVGPLQSVYFKTKRYIPVTLVSSVGAKQDELGRVELRISGRGFTEGGTIQKVILDRDSKEPFDYTFTLQDNDFKVQDNRDIEGPLVELFNKGNYRIGLSHPTRGLYFTPFTISLTPMGTVKLGDYSTIYKPPWELDRKPEVTVTLNQLVIGAIILFLVAVCVAAAIKLISVSRDGMMLRSSMLSLITGLERTVRKEEIMKELKRRGMGLRTKFTFLIAILVILIVLIISIPLSYTTIRTQTRTLANGLRDRATVLLGSISAGSEAGLID